MISYTQCGVCGRTLRAITLFYPCCGQTSCCLSCLVQHRQSCGSSGAGFPPPHFLRRAEQEKKKEATDHS